MSLPPLHLDRASRATVPPRITPGRDDHARSTRRAVPSGPPWFYFLFFFVCISKNGCNNLKSLENGIQI
jgi:hypothetical protein